MLEPDFMSLFLFGAPGTWAKIVSFFHDQKMKRKKLTRLGTARVISVLAKVQLSFEKSYLIVLALPQKLLIRSPCFWTLWKANEILSKSLFKGYLRPSKVRQYFHTKLMY